ncbi:unnamed protein product [Polarella glacialis]|uniref:RlmI-like PUA domain-containing protein n=1 Tax=Polarella glacialis TaxID=89957 RepID=A0A813FQ43_POLGL|nr:unnamed protein product [Polarella glacialis]
MALSRLGRCGLSLRHLGAAGFRRPLCARHGGSLSSFPGLDFEPSTTVTPPLPRKHGAASAAAASKQTGSSEHGGEATTAAAPNSDGPPEARLKQDLDRQLQLSMGHPWVYDDEVENISELSGFAAGTVVSLVSSSGSPMGVGVLNRQASIVIRRLEGLDKASEVTQELLRARLRRAFAAREARCEGAEKAFYGRAVNGEQDGLPGIFVDRFGKSAVAIFESLGSVKLEFLVQEELTRWIGKLQQLTIHRMTSKKEKWAQDGSEFTTSIVRGENSRVRVEERNSCSFDIDVHQGLMGHWNYGLEEVRQELAELLAQNGTVLDAWSHVGQWGIRCAKAGAAEVVLLEDSLALAQLCRDNASLNRVSEQCTVLHRGDVLEELRSMATGGIRFNCVSLNIRVRFERYFKQRRGQFGRWFKPSLKGYETTVYMGAMITGRGGYLVVSFLLPITSEYWALNLVQGGLERASRAGSLVHYSTSVQESSALASSTMEDVWSHVVVCVRLH